MKRSASMILLLCLATGGRAQDSLVIRKLSDEIMLRGQCYNDLRDLCKKIGHRLSGSPQAEQAVQWGKEALEKAGADKVWLQPVRVPHWVRGKESLKLAFKDGKNVEVPVLSIGNSQGTDGKLLEAEIVMVRDIEELARLKDAQIKDKIVFFNHHFPQELIETFQGYGQAGRYRWSAPNAASARGAAGVIIRSVSTGEDDFPHTGSMRYADTVKKIPAVAIGNKSADMLAEKYKAGHTKAYLSSECKMLGEVMSYNVIGEIKGSKYPDEIVLVGGHLDSWDVGEGAHDDGAGCVQSIEVIRALKAAGIKPKRTVRAVLFMNEENGLKGGIAYADSAKAKKEKHVLAIESDAGGFSPRGIGLDMKDEQRRQIQQYRNLFLPYGVYDFEGHESGADISSLAHTGVPAAGLRPDSQRYFDYHHTDADVFEAVNHRELKLGAVTLSALVYLVSEYGLR
jgi:carboxypeptidase Q